MRKIEITIMPDIAYAKLRAIIMSGIDDAESLLIEAIYAKEIEIRKTRGNRVIEYTKQDRIDYEKQLELEMKRLPPYWYTDEETEKYEKEFDEKSNYDNTLFEKRMNQQKTFLEALKNLKK